MKIAGTLIKFGEVTPEGDVFSEDCVISIPEITQRNEVKWNFNPGKPLGNVISVFDTGTGKDRSITVDVELNKDGYKLINRIK